MCVKLFSSICSIFHWEKNVTIVSMSLLFHLQRTDTWIIIYLLGQNFENCNFRTGLPCLQGFISWVASGVTPYTLRNKIKQPPLQIIPYPIGARLSDIVQFTIILTVLHIKPMKSDSELGPIWNNRKKKPTTQIRQPVKKKWWSVIR